MEWFGEPSWKLLGGLILLTFLLGFIWKTRPGKATLVGFLGALFLLILLFVASLWIETDGEKIKKQLQGMAAAANQKNWSLLEQGFSETFVTYGGRNRAWVSAQLRSLESNFGTRRVVLRQIAIESQKKHDLKLVRFTLRLDGGGGGMEIVEVEALMRKNQGRWLMEKVKVYRPLSGNSSPIAF